MMSFRIFSEWVRIKTFYMMFLVDIKSTRRASSNNKEKFLRVLKDSSSFVWNIDLSLMLKTEILDLRMNDTEQYRMESIKMFDREKCGKLHQLSMMILRRKWSNASV